MKKSIRINAEHARVWTLPKKAKRIRFSQIGPDVVVRLTKNRSNPKYSLAMTLANLLWPKNFPKIIATGIKKPTEDHSKITYSEQKVIEEESQNALEHYYQFFDGLHNWGQLKVFNPNAGQNVIKLAEKISRSGIIPNQFPMNVGPSRKGYVFFEVENIDLPAATKYIHRLPERNNLERLKKKQAIALIQAIKRTAGGKKFVSVHI